MLEGFFRTRRENAKNDCRYVNVLKIVKNQQENLPRVRTSFQTVLKKHHCSQYTLPDLTLELAVTIQRP